MYLIHISFSRELTIFMFITYKSSQDLTDCHQFPKQGVCLAGPHLLVYWTGQMLLKRKRVVSGGARFTLESMGRSKLKVQGPRCQNLFISHENCTVKASELQ